MEFSIRELLLVGMASIEELQRALKQLLNIFLSGLVRRKKFVQIELGKPAVRDSCGQEFPQPS